MIYKRRNKMNTIAVIGNLCKEVELRYSESEKAVLQNTVAVKQNRKNKEGVYESDFIDIVAFSNNAEFLGKYAKKGDKVGIQGKLHIDNYKDSEGNSKKRTYIVIDNVELLTSTKKEDSKEEEYYIDESKFPF